MPGSPGKVMYFTKPADSPSVIGTGLTAPTAATQIDDPARVPPIPDVPPLPVPPPDSIRNLPPVPKRVAQPPLVIPPEPPTSTIQTVPLKPQPGPSTSQKKKEEYKFKPVPKEYIQLPAREKIFMVYNDPELERVIMQQLVSERITYLNEEIKRLKGEGKDATAEEMQRKKLLAIQDNPMQDSEWQFPAMPEISPPGVPYQPKTISYPPRRVFVEPGYVVHRRLHFEELNSERYGWDLGAINPIISTLYFYKDVLLWPNSLASGCVHGFWDTSAGKCLPGSPTPYYLYPPGLTITGTVVEAGIITGAAFLFP